MGLGVGPNPNPNLNPNPNPNPIPNPNPNPNQVRSAEARALRKLRNSAALGDHSLRVYLTDAEAEGSYWSSGGGGYGI